MSMIYIVFPLALAIVIVAIIAFIWATRSGQFDDLDTPAMRVLHDQETPPTPQPNGCEPSEFQTEVDANEIVDSS